MALSLRACALRAAHRVIWPLLGVGVVALAGCMPDGQPGLTAALPRGASVAFESIDGPPPAQFRKLVDSLNEEAQARRLAVTSRESPSAFRVRGYLAAKVTKHETTVSWIWDVFDGDARRALRINGEETVKGRQRDAWAVADDAMLHRIARTSMAQLATFLTSPEVAPTMPAAPPVMAAASPAEITLIGDRDPTPEAAGIFRIFKPQADPVSEGAATAPGAKAVAVPLPRPRPSTAAPALSAQETLTLAASRR